MLRHVLSVGVVLVLALSVTGCSDPYESAAEKTVKKNKEFLEILKGVKTEADADAAKPKLDALAKDFDEIAAELKKQPKMTEDQKKKVEKVAKDAKADGEAVMKEMFGKDPKVMMKLGAAMEKVGKAGQAAAEQWREKGATFVK